MKILGISPLDKDATASLIEDGAVRFAAGEERFSRIKQHAGFPGAALREALDRTGTRPEEVDVVAYPFLTWDQETELIGRCLADEDAFDRAYQRADLAALMRAADARVPARTEPIFGLPDPNQKREKVWLKRRLYDMRGASGASRRIGKRLFRQWAQRASAEHEKWQHELHRELEVLGLLGKLKRYEHHISHAANAYFASGFERALIVTLDGYGSGLAGLVALGEGGRIRRLKSLRFPHSLGTFYETVTAALGFHPDRHAGKVVGLAAYGDPAVLSDVLLSRIEQKDGGYAILESLNAYFSFHLATRYPMIDVAAAYQRVLEIVATNLVKHWAKEIGCDAVVLSGGVTANVKMNQRIHEAEGIERLFVYPNMGDGGCGSGLGYYLGMGEGQAGGAPHPGEPIDTVYLGPEYTDAEIESALRDAGVAYDRPAHLAGEVAALVHGGKVVARFDGRMEYGPRALGNRSILYHASEPGVNQWLNTQLGRTEFMPFAPVTMWEHREKCYHHLAGAEHTAQFMTVTFDCTDWMKAHCPAAVHVDGTARPQLIKRETNPGYYDILSEYEKLTGNPCLINTSFNMHEEPIVCSPEDAIRAFQLGNLDALAIGPFLARGKPRER